jgi:hypothetical protein
MLIHTKRAEAGHDKAVDCSGLRPPLLLKDVFQPTILGLATFRRVLGMHISTTR